MHYIDSIRVEALQRPQYLLRYSTALSCASGRGLSDIITIIW